MFKSKFFKVLLTMLVFMSWNGIYHEVNAYTSLHGDPGHLNVASIGTSNVSDIYEFRIFLPPGTTYVAVYTYVMNNDYGISMVAHYGSAPENYNTANPVYAGLGGSTLEQLSTGNCYYKNTTGLMRTIDQRFSTPLSENQAGWLYVKILGATEDTLYTNQSRVEVNKDIYNAWYDTIDWFTDVETGNYYVPTSSTTTGSTTTGSTTTGSTTTGSTTTGSTTTSGDSAFGHGDTATSGTQTSGTTATSSDSMFACMLSGGSWINNACVKTNSSTNTSTSASTNPFTSSTTTTTDTSSTTTTTTTDTTTNTESNTTTTVTDPLLPVTCLFNAGQTSFKTQITDSVIGNRTEVLVQPKFSVPDMPVVPVEFFSLIEIRSLNRWYMAVQDAFHGDGIFMKLLPGMPVLGYGRGDLTGGNTWICNVFAENFSDLDIDVQLLKAYNVHYYAGFAPVGDVANGIYDNLRFVDIYF